jgi:hypothetical protein
VPYLVVGDVHGCVEELEELLRIAGSGRDVVLVGDLVGKGPDSSGVLALVRSIGARSVRGNHDQHLIRWHEAVARGDTEPKLSDAQREVAEELDQDDFAFLCSLPYFIRLEDEGAVVVHAGLVPGVSLDAQEPEHMLTLRSFRRDGSPSKRVEGGVPWASCWPGPELVVFGHDAVRGLQQYPHAVGLDTGCVYGGELTGYLLPERRLVSVPANREWSPKDPG